MCDELVASCCPHPGAQLSLCQAVAKLPGLSSCAWLAGVITSSQPGLTVSHNPSSLVPIPGRHSLLREELESGGPFQNCNDSLRRGEQAGNGECRPVRVSRTPSLGLTRHYGVAFQPRIGPRYPRVTGYHVSHVGHVSLML